MQHLHRLITLALILIFLHAGATAKVATFDRSWYKSHLETPGYRIDTEASAVVLYEHRSTDIVRGESKLSQKVLVHRIIRIMKQDALDLADIHMLFVQSDSESHIKNIQARSYNLTDTGMTVTVLPPSDMMTKEVNGPLKELSFTLPAVKEGTIIEYSYELGETDLDWYFTWEIEEQYPKLITEFSVSFHASIAMAFVWNLPQNERSFDNEDLARQSGALLGSVQDEHADVLSKFWIRRNVQARQSEPYLVNPANYRERMDAQINSILVGGRKLTFNSSWENVNITIWRNEGVKEMIHTPITAMYKDVDRLVTPGMSKRETIRTIFRFVRDNFNCTESGMIKPHELKKVYKQRQGNSTDLNLVLCAMLVHAGIEASPVLLSTVGHVSPTEKLPVMNRLNYLACAATLDSDYVMLDASDKWNYFDGLPQKCYNGYGIVVGDHVQGVMLSRNHLRDKNICGLNISNITDTSASAELILKLGMVRSADFRRAYSDLKLKETMLEKMKEQLPQSMKILSMTVANETNADTNIVINYKCALECDRSGNQIFINTDAVRFFDSNPFKAMTRAVPVEFPCVLDQSYSIRIALPDNIEPDEAMTPVELKFMDGAMKYAKQYNYMPIAHMLSVSSNLLVSKTDYEVESYPALRKYFVDLMNDANKMIVLKKK